MWKVSADLGVKAINFWVKESGLDEFYAYFCVQSKYVGL